MRWDIQQTLVRLPRSIRKSIGGHLATAKLSGNPAIELGFIDVAIGRLGSILSLHAPNGTIDAVRCDT